MELLIGIMPMLPSKDVKLACECILELVEFPNPLVRAVNMSMHHAFYESDELQNCV